MSAKERPPAFYRFVKSSAILTGLLALGLISMYLAMTWSLEPDRVEMPRVVGVESVAASEILKEGGLVPRVVAEEFHIRIPKGHVVSQRPSAGTRVKLGSEVRLILSRGTDQVEVPKLAGLTMPQAQRALAEAGLTAGPPLAIHSDAHAHDLIIAQDPPAGATAVRGSAVALLQSLGPWGDQIAMPDLTGRELVAAMNLLKELQIEAVVTFAQAATREGHVVAQDPATGASVKIGSQVKITVGE
jgi:eukaryotic-like serine/threonine-protein kinase